MKQQQLQLIDYLREENRVRREQLAWHHRERLGGLLNYYYLNAA